MGRAAIALGPADGSPGILDRSVTGRYQGDERGGRGESDQLDRTGPLLSRSSSTSSPGTTAENPRSEQEEVVLRAIWIELAPAERSSFGTCFSRMVLRMLKEEQKEAAG